MMTGFMLLVAAAAALALFQWRLGLLAMVLVGVLQDPARKMTPGSPGFMALCAGMVWAGAVAGAVLRGEVRWRHFRLHFRGLSNAIALFTLLLVPAAIRSATYSEGSWQITLVGVFIYGSLLTGIMLGEVYPRTGRDQSLLLGTYCVLTALATTGVLLDRLGWKHPALGTIAMGYTWVTHRVGESVYMLAGFYRSPDIQGWHAAMLVMLAFVMAARHAGWWRLLWLASASVGVLGVTLCGRRKMVAMLVVFFASHIAISLRHGRLRHLGWLVVACLAIGVVGFQVYQTLGESTARERFYLTTLDTARDDMRVHGFDAIIGTYKQAGFFGYGLGMATQGTQHIVVDRPRTWQESGPGKLMAELGVPGLIGFIILAGALLGHVLDILRRMSDTPLYPTLAGLTSILIANGAMGMVSAQLFGDPFIATFLSLLTGILLAAVRTRRPATIDPLAAPAPPAEVAPP
jgi:hypothetical protein